VQTFLIKNARTYAPQDLGVCDVLCWGDRILDVGRDLWPPEEPAVFQAEGRVLLPGLIDTHIHVMGASGGGGPAHRSPEMPLSWITLAGITSVVSPLGTDSLSRTIPALLSRAAALRAEGISAWIYTGGWRNPVPTLTGDVMADVAYVDAVLGVKVAIAEPAAPSLSVADLCLLAHAAAVGSGIGGKAGVLHAHIGDRGEGLLPLREAMAATGLPPARFVATHVNRNPGLWEQAQIFARDGAGIDLTSQVRKDRGYDNAIEPDRALLQLLDTDLPAANVTLSSDSGGAYRRPPTSRKGTYTMAEPATLFDTLRRVVAQGAPWEKVAPLATRNAADRLGLARKGRIEPGADADLLLLSPDNEVDHLWARGRLMVADGEAVVRSDYE
jgi:beta-aspartyl-dipeptidase (metallo-type)